MNLETDNKNEINFSTQEGSDCDEKFKTPRSPKKLDGGLDDLSDSQYDNYELDDSKEPENENINGLDFDDENEEYFLVSSNGEKFQITLGALSLSGLAKNALSGDESERIIPIPRVESHILEIIIKYLEYHSNEPVPSNNIPDKISSGVFSEQVKCKWDVKFINDIMSDSNTAKINLYDLINAANYMDIKTLLDLGCTKVAAMIKGESLDSIKKIIATDVPYVDNHLP